MNGRSEANSPDPAPISPEKLANQIRFETELEFVQCLANPHYLASLASQGLLAQPNFVAYLKYLTYWLDIDKGFARFIVYPHALHHLALLQQPSFREALKDPELRMSLEREQYLHWRTWRTLERNLVPTNTHLHTFAEETDSPTPNPSRVSRRSATARSSGARTPASRTPRTVRTPGAVRTPAIGATARTPATRSTLSVSVTMDDHMAEVGLAMPNVSNLDSTTTAAITSPAVVTQEAHQNMVMDSPTDTVNMDTNLGEKGTFALNGISAPSQSSATVGTAVPTIPPSTGTNMDTEGS